MFAIPVKAAALNKTKAEAVTWCKNKIGKSGVDYDGAYGVQCVDLIREYTTWLGKDMGPVSSGSASGYATQAIPTSYYTRYGNSTKPAAGDIFVWGNNAYGAGSYGHTGVIYEVGSNYYKYIDYDGVTHRGAVANTRKDGISNFTAIIRPNFKAAATASYSQILSDDRYYIESAVGNNQYLTVAGHSGKDNVNIQTYNSTLINDVFTVSHVGSGYYKFKNYITGKCVDIQGSTFTSGTNVHQYIDNGNDEQKWGLVKAGNGYYYIRSKTSAGLSLDVKGGANANGTNIQVYNNNTSNAQKWKFITDGRKIGKTIEPGYYYIKSGVGNNQYLNVNGTNVEINNAKSIDQIFYVKYINNGRYSIRHYNTNKMLDVPGFEVAYMGNNVGIAVPDSGRDQEWIIEKSGSAYEIVNRINGCRLDVYNALTKNGTNVGLHRKNGSVAQKYTFEKVVMPTGISLNKTNLVLEVGKTAVLTATVTPSNAADKQVTWTTSNASVATVSANGKIKAKKAGKVIISAVNMSDQVASCTVTVTNATLVMNPLMQSVQQFSSSIKNVPDSKEAKEAVFSLLQAKAKKVTKKSITLKWSKIYGSTGYIIYGSKCGKANKYKKIAEVGSGSKTSKKITSIDKKKLKKGTYYKFIVAAVKGEQVIAVSKSVHIITAGDNRYGDWTGVKLKNISGNKLKLSKGKQFKIKAEGIRPKNKKVKEHRALCYESDNPSVAKVSKKGVITARKKGTAVIYVYAQNGLFEKIVVKVKG